MKMKEIIETLEYLLANDSKAINDNKISKIVNNIFDNYIRKNEEYSELKKEVGAEKYDAYILKIKELNKDYYAFEWFFGLEQIENKELILKDIFLNSVLNNNFKNIEKNFGGINDDKKKEYINLICKTLFNISFYCVKGNFDGCQFSDILIKYYNCPKKTALSIAELYNQNKMDIKLTYLISALSNK